LASLRDKQAALQSGADAEAAVARLLESQGWLVLARKWRGGNGELDLVVRDGFRLRIVEVKLRQAHDAFGLVEEVCFLVALVLVGPEGWQIHLYDDPV